MKVIRFTFIAFIALTGLMLIGAAIAYTSVFQTWATHRTLARHPEWATRVGKVDARLQHLHLEQLSVAKSGMTLTVPSLDAELPVVAAARQELHIKRLVAKGWTLDLTTKAAAVSAVRPARGFSFLSSAYAADPSAAMPAAVTVFQGVVSQLKLSVDLSVDAVELEGEVILPSVSGEAPVRMKVTITGGQLGAGREGKFLFAANTTLAPTAPVNAVGANGTMLIAMDSPRTFSRLAADFRAEARGREFPEGTLLTFNLSAAKANAGESYTFVAEAAGRKLVTVQAAFPDSAEPPAQRRLEGTWMINAMASDVTPFALGRPIPAFVAKGAGRFNADATFSTLAANGRIDATADDLGLVRPELRAIGAVNLGADFDLFQSGSTIRVTAFSAELASAKPVMNVRALQPFEFNAKTGELKIADPSADLVNVAIPGIPLAWVQPFLRDVAVSGDDVRGSFVVGARNGGFAARGTAPLTVGNLSIAQGGRELARAVDAAVMLAADYAPQGWQLEVKDLVVRSGVTPLFAGEMKAGQLSGAEQPVKVTGRWSANLPALGSQPFAAGYAALTGGKAEGEVVASFGATREFQAQVGLSGLAVDPKLMVVTMPSIQMDARALIDSAGKITLTVPLIFEREGRKSDFTLAGTVTPRPSNFEIDGHLTSTYLAVDDAQLLAAPFALRARSASRTPGELPAVGRDTVPAWSGLSGRITLALKKVAYQQKFEVNDIAGSLQIDAGTVKLEGLHAGMGQDSELTIGGAVTFDSKAQSPYALTADLALANFDTVPLFRALDPGKPATVEGKFNATSQLLGNAGNVVDLIERTRGNLHLSSKSGISRLLSADVSDKIQKTGSTVAALGELLGAMTGKEKIADFANKGQIVTDIANSLKEIPYDQLNVAVTRGSDLNFNLKDFTLISPEVRLTGTGEIHYNQGVPVLAQPLDLKLQLGTRGKLAELMNRASLLDGTQDNLGYAGFSSPLRIAGTMENPDTSDIRNVLLKAAGGSLLKIW